MSAFKHLNTKIELTVAYIGLTLKHFTTSWTQDMVGLDGKFYDRCAVAYVVCGRTNELRVARWSNVGQRQATRHQWKVVASESFPDNADAFRKVACYVALPCDRRVVVVVACRATQRHVLSLC